MVAHLREQGKLAEATQLETKIGEHRQQLAEFRDTHDGETRRGERERSDPRAINFREPTQEQAPNEGTACRVSSRMYSHVGRSLTSPPATARADPVPSRLQPHVSGLQPCATRAATP